jgi:putative endonuclease
MHEEREYYVYILTNKKYGTLYTGVTNCILRRTHEHRSKLNPSFTQKYSLNKLVYFEIHQDIHEALLREKQIKSWQRNWKINLIEASNPKWLDLLKEILT